MIKFITDTNTSSNYDSRIHVLEKDTTPFTILKNIAESGCQENAFYVADISDIVEKHRQWTTKIPRVLPHYAVKCNPDPIVLKVLAALGAGFDCASKEEIRKVLELGVGPERIIFAHTLKAPSHIKHAATSGIDLMTFDNESELYKIKQVFPKAKLVLRIKYNAKKAIYMLGTKFGCDPDLEAPMLLQTARNLELNVVGVAFHVGSGCQDLPVYKKAIGICRELFDYASTLGYNFNLLDIGGGFPGERGSSIDEIASIVNEAIDAYFPDTSVKIISEPGAFFVSSAFTLASNVISSKFVKSEDIVDKNYNYRNYYYINEGVYNSFGRALYENMVGYPLKISSGILHPSKIWGGTCCPCDEVTNNIFLPEMQTGEWLIFENMGAYTISCSSSFNGFQGPKMHYVVNKNVWKTLKNVLPLKEKDFVRGGMPKNIIKGLDLEGLKI